MEWLGPTTLVNCGEALGDDDEDSKRLKYKFSILNVSLIDYTIETFTCQI